MRALLLFLIFAFLRISVAQAMTNDELAMTRNVAERGNPSAQVLLAIAYLHGDGGLTADPAEAARWFEKAALQGNGFAEGRLADLYEKGSGVKQNLKVAADWRERSAKRGNIEAQRKLGRMYLRGEGVAQDYALARKWLQEAADGGDAEAAYLLSHMYRHGLGSQRDPDLASNWLAKSAERGYLEAIRLLHSIEAFGLHYDKSLSKDALHTLAADGDADAQYQLGLHYESGSGGEPKDVNQAIEWFRRSAAQGNESAKRALAHLGAAKAGAPVPGSQQAVPGKN